MLNIQPRNDEQLPHVKQPRNVEHLAHVKQLNRNKNILIRQSGKEKRNTMFETFSQGIRNTLFMLISQGKSDPIVLLPTRLGNIERPADQTTNRLINKLTDRRAHREVPLRNTMFVLFMLNIQGQKQSDKNLFM